MAYVKPGVTVKQVQTSVSPILENPSLVPCIIGQGSYVVETDDQLDVYTDATLVTVKDYSNLTDTVAYLNMPEKATMESDSVYVDILTTNGWKHVDEEDLTKDPGANTVTIASGLGASYNAGKISIGYYATLSGLDEYFTVDSIEYVTQKIGKPTSYNPLAFGLVTALGNSGRVVAAYGVENDSDADHLAAVSDTLSMHEVYALAPMTHASVESTYKSHVELMSAESMKKERIVYLNSKADWFESDATTFVSGPNDENVDKAGTAQALATKAAGVRSKRTFYTHSDTVYIEESRPIATVKQSFLALTNALATNYNLFSKFTSNWAYKPGTVNEVVYYTGDDITDTAHTHLMDNDYGFGSQTMTVEVPVPGYYMSAALAGMTAGQRPEQPFTNLSIAGPFTKLKFSGDYYTEAQLNTIAGGGTWIMWQKNVASSILTRHQLSTDRSSVETQERSITAAIDFVSKFVRDGVEPYIGKYVISPSFLKMLKTILIGQASYLKKEGYVNDIKVDKVEQDAISKDTINVTFSILAKYPVNYIKITLQF